MNTTLTSFTLVGLMDDEGICAFGDALKVNTTLTSLTLQAGPVDGDVGRWMAMWANLFERASTCKPTYNRTASVSFAAPVVILECRRATPPVQIVSARYSSCSSNPSDP